MVGLGGFVGSVLRYKAGLVIMSRTSTNFPFGTFFVNLVGAFLIGLLVSSAMKFQQSTMLLLVTGFCGGFTTFSAFALENLRLMQSENWLVLFAYIALSLFGGLGLCWAGYVLGSSLNS